jgi:hypothetical protein
VDLEGEPRDGAFWSKFVAATQQGARHTTLAGSILLRDRPEIAQDEWVFFGSAKAVVKC